MQLKATLKYIPALLLMALLTSCIATKSYKKPELDTKTENLYPFDRVEMDSTTLADMPWENVFKDPKLQSLIEEALNNNLELQKAIQQIRVAEADFYEGKMRMYPNLSIGGSVAHNEVSDNSINFGSSLQDIVIPGSETYTVSASSSWELDVWGKLNSAKKASYAALLQTEATKRAVQTRLIAQVAGSYYRLLALDRQLEVTRQTVENRKEDVEAIKSLKENGLANGVSVQQSIANRYAAEVMIPELKQRITEQEHALSNLLGRAPGSIERSELSSQQPIDSLAAGMPAQLLENRPDIRAAEYSFRTAFELTNNARTYFYPQFQLTARGGYQSLRTSDLFEPGSIFYNLAAGLTQPIFANGQNKARLKRRRAQQEQALLDFKNTVITASTEVSNAMSKFRNAEQQLALRNQQLDALEKAVDYSRELLQYGEASYVEVLTARQSLLSARLSNISDRLQQLTAGVELYRALGGGWKNADTTEAK